MVKDTVPPPPPASVTGQASRRRFVEADPFMREAMQEVDDMTPSVPPMSPAEKDCP